MCFPQRTISSKQKDSFLQKLITNGWRIFFFVPMPVKFLKKELRLEEVFFKKCKICFLFLGMGDDRHRIAIMGDKGSTTTKLIAVPIFPVIPCNSPYNATILGLWEGDDNAENVQKFEELTGMFANLSQMDTVDWSVLN